jgi:hypothetical protein
MATVALLTFDLIKPSLQISRCFSRREKRGRAEVRKFMAELASKSWRPFSNLERRQSPSIVRTIRGDLFVAAEIQCHSAKYAIMSYAEEVNLHEPSAFYASAVY